VAARKTRRGKKAEPSSRGLSPGEVAGGASSDELEALERQILAAEGTVLARYREPLGGRWLALAALPLARIAPTPFQRDLSDAHVKRLEDVIQRVGSFLDPVIAVPAPEGAGKARTPAKGRAAPSGEVRFWSPNGFHRLSALQRMGARTVTALVSPDPALAYRILALNTEKAHNTKERSLEAVRMAQGLAEVDPKRKESDFGLELEDGSLVTLGFAYQQRPRFAGGAYAPALRQSDAFLDQPLERALEERSRRAERLLAIDDRVSEIMAELKERGFESPYLRNFVVARIRPFRPRGKAAPGPDELLDHMEKAAASFDAGKVRGDQISRTGGGGD
jgi:ParB family chromosome partitioning protein